MKFPCVILLYSFSQSAIFIGICYISEKVQSLINGKYPLIWLDFLLDVINPLMYQSPALPKVQLARSPDKSIITIPIKVFDFISIFEIMVEIYGQQEIANSLRCPYPILIPNPSGSILTNCSMMPRNFLSLNVLSSAYIAKS